jgi:ATPase subunit of ABC transporter with duplicated ATPase domains
VISHDRYFLEKIVDRVAEVDRGRLVEFPGGFAYYHAKKLERQAQAQAAAARPPAKPEPAAKGRDGRGNTRPGSAQVKAGRPASSQARPKSTRR